MPIDPSKPFDLRYEVTQKYPGWRLDQFVRTMVPSMSRTRIQNYIREQRISVNGQPRPANWRVRLGDQVVLHCREPEGGAVAAAQNIPLDVLYEDDEVLVLNKQPGVVVHPVGIHRHDTLLNALYWRYKELLPPEQEVSLANRLDQYTSGVILVAKSTGSKRMLQGQFENRETAKVYVALCEGLVDRDAGEIDAPIGPGPDGGRYSMAVRTDEAGKPSLTVYNVLERFPPCAGALNTDRGYTLVRLEPHTGRQHQLRVHMAHLGHPLVCDDRYGLPRPLLLRAADGRTGRLGRYALHACALTFQHPDGRTMTVEAPLAEDLRVAVELLRAGAERRLGELTGLSDEDWPEEF